MATNYARSRDEVIQGMNALIDARKIVMPSDTSYCFASTLEKLKKQAQDDLAWKKQHPDGKQMTCADFDKMKPQEKMDFAVSGGRIAG